MAIEVEELWRLAIEGGLFVEAERQDLTSAYDRARGDKPPEAIALCKWLIERGMLSRYQAKLLTNGRSGPFHFGDFRVYDRVEKGRLAGLFRAGNLHSGQPALLYFFAGPNVQDAARWQAVEAAAQAAISIKHPHVSRVDELVRVDGYKFMVLESLDGHSLAELTAGKPLAPVDVCRYIRKAAAGLARLHNLGRIHGDVRPDNLLVDSTGQLKLLYFPLASDPFAPAGSDARNADFLAPERSSPHNRPPDVRSDIYALGATMYTLLAGRPPFVGGDAADKTRRHAGEPLAPLEQVAKTPASLSRLVALMMAKNPQGRPGSATEVADALLSIVERKSAKTPAAAPPNAAPPNAAPPNAAPPQGAPSHAMPPGGAPPAAFPPSGAYAGQPSPTAPPTAAPQTAAPPAAMPPTPSWGMPPTQHAPNGPASVAASAGPAFGAPNPAAPSFGAPNSIAPPGAPNVGSHPQAGMPVMGTSPGMPPGSAAYPGAIPAPQSMPATMGLGAAPGIAQPSAWPGGPNAQPNPFAQPNAYPQPSPFAQPMHIPPSATGPAMNQSPPLAPAAQTVAPPAYVPAPADPNPPLRVSASPRELPAPAAELQFDYPAPPPAPAAPAVAQSGHVARDIAPRAAPRRNPAAVKRAPRLTGQPPKKPLDPKLISGAVAAAVFIVGGLIFFSMTGEKKAVPISQSDEMEQVRREMEIAEKAMSGASGAKGAKTKSHESKSTRPDGGDNKTEGAVADNAMPKSNDDGDTLTIVEDDNQTLWASPTSGAPLDLHYVPRGTRMIMALRPAALLQSLEGEKILAALGPGGAAAKQELEAMVGVPLGDVEQLLACFFSLDTGPPQLALVARLGKAHAPADLVAAWKNPTAVAANANFYKGAQWAYYLPPAGENKVFSVMPLKEMAEAEDQAADASDDVVEMGKEMDKLARQTDSTRTFTLLVSPTWLNGPGKPLLDGAFSSLRAPLNDFLGEEVRAVELSLNWGDDFFAEVRAFSSIDGPQELANRFKDNIAQLSDRVDSYTAALNPGPYSRRVLLRLPEWLRVTSEYTRVGEDEQQAVVRCYLPSAAGHNLLMASELLLSQSGGGGGGVASAAPKKPSGPAEALNQKISLSFTRDTLEKCMEFLSKEIDTEIVIVGGDLQLEGITKNQSFGLDEKDKPAGEILRSVMLKANTDGKLVYVFKPKAPGGKDIIFITTRASVAKNKYKLPPELEKAAAPPAKK